MAETLSADAVADAIAPGGIDTCVYINQGVSFSSMAWQPHAIEQTQLRSQYHEDGVGRLKLDFHTGIDSGHTAWILMSCALVRRPGVFIRAAAHMSTTQVNFMTPGLAFFYGGLVRRNHVLSIIIQNYVSISASRGAAAPSRHRRDSCPSQYEVGGFFLDFGAIRTASRPRRPAQVAAGRRAGLPGLFSLPTKGLAAGGAVGLSLTGGQFRQTAGRAAAGLSQLLSLPRPVQRPGSRERGAAARGVSST